MPDKFDLVLRHEVQFAKRLGALVMEKPQVSVWMFLFPIVLIPFMQRMQQFQQSLDLFTRGYLFTKQLALDAALKVSTGGLSKEEAVAGAALQIKSSEGAGQDEGNDFADARQKVRELQIKEIELLVDHYHDLLSSTGNSYRSLVIGAYKFKENYVRFLKRLAEAEKQVNQASLKAYGDEVENLFDTITKMEQSLIALRTGEIQQIFGSNCQNGIP